MCRGRYMTAGQEPRRSNNKCQYIQKRPEQTLTSDVKQVLRCGGRSTEGVIAEVRGHVEPAIGNMASLQSGVVVCRAGDVPVAGSQLSVV